jgi:phosphatidylserine decarboxylase
MLRSSPRRGFFKSHSHLPLSSPLRRWVHLQVGAAVIGAIAAAPVVSYCWTAATAADAPASFAARSIQGMMEMAPLNLLSRTVGDAASSRLIPRSAHAAFIRAFVWAYGVDANDCDPLDSYATAQDFFCRRLRGGARSRPLPTSDGTAGGALAAELVSPCDGEVLACGEVDGDRTLLQVKGHRYPVEGLFRLSLPPAPAPASGLVRTFVVFHLRPGDYHRVHAPRDMRVRRTLHVPGLLLPTTATAMRWLPNVVMSNERVLAFADRVPPAPAATSDASPSVPEPAAGAGVATVAAAAAPPFVGMALVGAACVGGIVLSLDERIATNLAEPPETSVAREYGAAAPVVRAGDEVGYFRWGSCVVLIADTPSALPLRVKAGDDVRQGQWIV